MNTQGKACVRGTLEPRGGSLSWSGFSRSLVSSFKVRVHGIKSRLCVVILLDSVLASCSDLALDECGQSVDSVFPCGLSRLG